MLYPGDTHYMLFVHGTTGLSRSDWSVQIFKDGVKNTSIDYAVTEKSTYHYILSFKNDGTPDTQWAASVSLAVSPVNYYTESWEVGSRTLEETVKFIRARLDGFKDLRN